MIIGGRSPWEKIMSEFDYMLFNNPRNIVIVTFKLLKCILIRIML